MQQAPFLYSKKEFHPFDQIGLFPGPDLPVRDLQDVFFADVDDLGLGVAAYPGLIHAVDKSTAMNNHEIGTFFHGGMLLQSCVDWIFLLKA